MPALLDFEAHGQVTEGLRLNLLLAVLTINPIWRGETIGSYALVFDAILIFDRLSADSDSNEARKKR